MVWNKKEICLQWLGHKIKSSSLIHVYYVFVIELETIDVIKKRTESIDLLIHIEFDVKNNFGFEVINLCY